MELEYDCPVCDAEEFYQAASTKIHLGEKIKWRCTNCDYTFVRIDGNVDTGAVA